VARLVAVTDADCLFCKIAAGEVEATVVLETEHVLAFRDVNPQAPTHVLVIPREHHIDVGALAADAPDVLAELITAATEVAVDEDLAVDGDNGGHRLVFNTGRAAGQSVFHVHGHVLGGRRLAWPPG
jgi:histidine triad (HIT) family protein